MDGGFQFIEKDECISNDRRQTNLLESDAYTSASGKINIPLGINDAGEVIVTDLASIPHILICGHTCTGKTSFIQTTLAVVCKNTSPDDVKLIIIDSKGIDYSPFMTVPHLLAPILTESDKVVAAIKWMTAEIKDRMERFGDLLSKNLDNYNSKVDSKNKLPEIIVVIDDIANMDLKRDALDDLRSILLNGRVAGLHLVVVSTLASTRALQKELIANIPCKIAFKLSSKAESKAILETYGAEALHIPGEMIFKYQYDIKKCQCAYSEFGNIKSVMMSVKRPAVSISELGDIAAGVFEEAVNECIGKEENGDDLDSLLYDAGLFVITNDRARIGSLQRKFMIGFNRAARIMDQLYDFGVVSEDIENKPREVRMTVDAWNRKCVAEGIIAEDIVNRNDGEKATIHTNSGSVEQNFDSKIQIMHFERSTKDSDIDDEEEKQIELRDFAEFEADGACISISDNKIKYNKDIMTKQGPGHMSPSFGALNITKIIYKKPSLISKGFFTFEFLPDVNVIVDSSLLDVDDSNLSEVLKVQFGLNSDRTIRLFLQQISEDTGLPITHK